MPPLFRSRSSGNRPWRFARALVGALALLALPACEKTTVVMLVRHAEPGNTPLGDPNLDPVLGTARAQELATVLARSGLSAVFHTQLNRSRQTADPVVSALSVPRIEVPLTGGQEQQNADSIATHIRSTFQGRNVLVVGHTTTLHLIAAALGVPNPQVVPPNEFNNLFILIRRGTDSVRVVHARYGQ